MFRRSTGRRFVLDLQATIAAMKEAGLTPDQIIAALVCVRFCPVDIPQVSGGHDADKRRAYDRERKRLAREKAKKSTTSTAPEVSAPAVNGVVASVGMSTGQTGHGLVVSSTPPSLILEQTVEKEVLKKKIKGSGDARASRLPADFVPDDTCEAIAREHHLTKIHWQRTIDGFRDYWKAQPGGRGLKADWQATCRNWLRREADNMKGPGNGTTGIRSQRHSTADSFAEIDAAVREIKRREAGAGEPDSQEDHFLLPGLR